VPIPDSCTAAIKRKIANFIEKASRLHKQKCCAALAAPALEMIINFWRATIPLQWTLHARFHCITPGCIPGAPPCSIVGYWGYWPPDSDGPPSLGAAP
jgi:hypothetical protein